MNKILLSSMIALSTFTIGSVSGDSSSGTTQTPSVIGTGSNIVQKMEMDGEMRALHIAIQKLTPADRATLKATIKSFLESKGVQIPTLAEIDALKQKGKEIKKEIKDIKDQKKQEIKDTRDSAKKAIQAKREAMKEALKAKREAMKEKQNEFNSSRSNREVGN